MLRVRIDIKSEEINNINTVIASLLTLEVLFGEEKKRKITFDSRKNSVIRIGRLKSDEIEFEFEDEDVSRKQCMIFFEDNNWYILSMEMELNQAPMVHGFIQKNIIILMKVL